MRSFSNTSTHSTSHGIVFLCLQGNLTTVVLALSSPKVSAPAAGVTNNNNNNNNGGTITNNNNNGEVRFPSAPLQTLLPGGTKDYPLQSSVTPAPAASLPCVHNLTASFDSKLASQCFGVIGDAGACQCIITQPAFFTSQLLLRLCQSLLSGPSRCELLHVTGHHVTVHQKSYNYYP